MRSGSATRTRLSDLTDTQRRVLDLIAAGKTNYEIGQAFGITLDGAKYHVTEILNKLGVDSREEAADWWRAQQRPATRLARAFALPAAKWVFGGAAAAAAIVVVVVALALFGSNDDPSAVPHIQAAFLQGDDPSGPRRIIVVDDEGNQRQVGEERRYLAVDWAPDGKKLLALALGPKPGDALFWMFDLTSGEVSSWPPGEPLQWWKWSPDSSRFALLLTGRLAIFETDGKEVASLDLPPSTGHSSVGFPVLWSPDSRWAAGTDRDVLAVLSIHGEGSLLELPSDFTAERVALVAWDSATKVVITDPIYLGRPQPEALAWMAAVTVAPVQWTTLPYTPPAPPSETEVEKVRILAGVTEETFRPLVTAEGRGTAYVFYSPRSGTPLPAVTAVVVSADGRLTKLTVPLSVTILGVPRQEVSVVVTGSR